MLDTSFLDLLLDFYSFSLYNSSILPDEEDSREWNFYIANYLLYREISGLNVYLLSNFE